MGKLKRLALPLILGMCLLLAACGGKAERADITPSSEAVGGSAESEAPTQRVGILFQAEEGEYFLLTAAQLADGDEASMSPTLSYSGPMAYLSISADKNAGLQMSGVVGDAGQNFADDFTLEGAFDEYGQLASGYMAQITAMDLDGDAAMEVIATIGDGATQCQSVVYAYSGGMVPFEAVGTVDGEAYMGYNKGAIVVPRGSEGAFDAWVLKDGEIVPYEG